MGEDTRTARNAKCSLLSTPQRYKYVRASCIQPHSAKAKRFILFISDVPSGAMMEPWVDSSWPRSMRYGALGSVIAHEYTHGFDSLGEFIFAELQN